MLYKFLTGTTSFVKERFQRAGYDEVFRIIREEYPLRSSSRLLLYERARSGRLNRRMGQRLNSLAAVAEAARMRLDGRLRDEPIAAMLSTDPRRVKGWRPSPRRTYFGGKGRQCADRTGFPPGE